MAKGKGVVVLRFQIWAPTLDNSVTLGEFLHIPEPQFSHLYSGVLTCKDLVDSIREMLSPGHLPTCMGKRLPPLLFSLLVLSKE